MLGMHAASGGLSATERVLPLYLRLLQQNSSCTGKTKQEQVYHTLQATIRSLGPGHGLPTAGKLASLIGVSRGTVIAVYERLVDEGCLKPVRGWGMLTRALANNVENETCPTRPSVRSSSSAEVPPAG
jgi:GntR family transcriptional regulator/MocR family aminotransferase